MDAITSALTADNAVSLLSSYDVILDCTDNLPTRYLLSDTAVALGRPLVSGAAQQFEGQLCNYNSPPGVGPCFRCLFPRPPAPEFAGGCEELGILGAVTGVIGNLQALEAIKLIISMHGLFTFQFGPTLGYVLKKGLDVNAKPTILMYSARSVPPFRSIKLRARLPTCPACGEEGKKIDTISQTDYVALCGGQRPDWEARGLVEHNKNDRIKATVGLSYPLWLSKFF